MKPIFENEEECRKYLRDIIKIEINDDYESAIDFPKTISLSVENSIDKGYIIKSELEIAENVWNTVVANDSVKLHHAAKYIELLENERLKK